MEIVSVERKTFEEMMVQAGAFVEKVAALQRRGDEVCQRLRISPRTLQTLRDRGFIGHSQIGHKFFYKLEDVKRVIPLVGTIYPKSK